MKFISTKLNGRKRLECSAPFDTEFIRELEVGEDNTIFFNYEIEGFQSDFPINVSRAYFSVKPTIDNLFSWTTIYIDGDNTPIRKFLNDWGNDWNAKFK